MLGQHAVRIATTVAGAARSAVCGADSKGSRHAAHDHDLGCGSQGAGDRGANERASVGPVAAVGKDSALPEPPREGHHRTLLHRGLLRARAAAVDETEAVFAPTLCDAEAITRPHLKPVRCSGVEGLGVFGICSRF